VQPGAELVMHHGPVVIDHPLRAAMEEILAWAAHSDPLHPENDLVLIEVQNCNATDEYVCVNRTRDLFNELHIPLITCDSLLNTSLTLGQALDLSALPNGGHVLAYIYCWNNPWTYNDSLECSGFTNTSEDFEFRAAAKRCLNLTWDGEEFMGCLTFFKDLLQSNAHYACTDSNTQHIAFDQLLAWYDNERHRSRWWGQ
jgi:hypothetical protein